jgi:hypothetical protein
MEFKGTKGKWILEDGKEIMCNNNLISTGYGFMVKNRYTVTEESRANALLISKAPEMLEMLQLTLVELETGAKKHWEIYGMIEQLIKEATELK